MFDARGWLRRLRERVLADEPGTWPTQAQIDAARAMDLQVADARRRLCDRMGYVGDPTPGTVFLLMGQLLQRVEDLEHAAGGRTKLSAHRQWLPEKGVDV